MKTVLIVGASRGIGREFVGQYLHDGWRVIATARDAAALAAPTERPPPNPARFVNCR